MKPTNIFTEPIKITDICECRIEKCVNEHFKAVVTGYIQIDKLEESYFNSVWNKPFIINVSTEEQAVISIFRGKILDIQMKLESGLTKITVTAKSMTVELDMKNHTRTYQGEGQAYRKIVDTVLSYYDNVATIHPKGKGVLAKGLVVQYEETDWQFLKRLASQLHTVLVADCTNDHICFFFGNPETRREISLSMSEYQIGRYMSFRSKESIEYIIYSREILNLCEKIFIEKYPYYIYEIKGSMENNELKFQYRLRPSSGFEVPENSHEGIAGISIMGEVTDARDTDVRVRLLSEADYDFENPIWFPYSTVYSSPDGAGWYCMPEKGDRVRLYIPDHREHLAYVISSVHLENNRNLRKNVDEKCIRTKYDKEIRFTPDKILITNHKGGSIVLDDKEGITIKSNRKINIISGNEVEIKGGRIQLEGQEGVILMEGPNMLMVRDGIKEQGMNIEHR